MEDFILSALSNFGFPAIVCFYLLTRVTTAIDNNTKALTELSAKLNALDGRK